MQFEVGNSVNSLICSELFVEQYFKADVSRSHYCITTSLYLTKLLKEACMAFAPILSCVFLYS